MQIVADHYRARMTSTTSDGVPRLRTARVSDLEMMLEFSRQEISTLSCLVAEAQKDTQDALLMLREADHRANNSLRTAASTLQAQAAEVSDPAARAQILNAIQDLRHLAATFAAPLRT